MISCKIFFQLMISFQRKPKLSFYSMFISETVFILEIKFRAPVWSLVRDQ